MGHSMVWNELRQNTWASACWSLSLILRLRKVLWKALIFMSTFPVFASTPRDIKSSAIWKKIVIFAAGN